MTDTQGLASLVAASERTGTLLIVLLGGITALTPVVLATLIWSLGDEDDTRVSGSRAQ